MEEYNDYAQGLEEDRQMGLEGDPVRAANLRCTASQMEAKLLKQVASETIEKWREWRFRLKRAKGALRELRSFRLNPKRLAKKMEVAEYDRYIKQKIDDSCRYPFLIDNVLKPLDFGADLTSMGTSWEELVELKSVARDLNMIRLTRKINLLDLLEDWGEEYQDLKRQFDNEVKKTTLNEENQQSADSDDANGEYNEGILFTRIIYRLL